MLFASIRKIWLNANRQVFYAGMTFLAVRHMVIWLGNNEYCSGSVIPALPEGINNSKTTKYQAIALRTLSRNVGIVAG
jgi:hypothetical protein